MPENGKIKAYFPQVVAKWTIRLCETKEAVAEALGRDGYARHGCKFISGYSGADFEIALAAFLESIRELPADPDCAAGNRCRRQARFWYLPQSDILESLRPIWDAARQDYVLQYVQAGDVNREHAGKSRIFSALTGSQRTNLFLTTAIRTAFASLPWRIKVPVFVDVHVIRLVARPNAPSASSPDEFHFDAQPYTFAFLLERIGVTGGENIIGPPEFANRHPTDVDNSAIISRFTLDDALEGYVVDDRAVTHYVSPVEVAAGCAIGWRTILLIDFTPAIPGLVH